jgi:hypothetical protein
VRADLEQAKQVAHAHHATVNDLVLCTIAGVPARSSPAAESFTARSC